MATASQQAHYNRIKALCGSLGVPQYTLAHKHLKGTISAPSSTGNTVYTGPGPLRGFDAQFSSQTLVWCATQTFLRGEQREEDWQAAMIMTPMIQMQVPAIDDYGNTVSINEDDFMIDSNGSFWKIMNPVIDPSQCYWSMMGELQR